MPVLQRGQGLYISRLVYCMVVFLNNNSDRLQSVYVNLATVLLLIQFGGGVAVILELTTEIPLMTLKALWKPGLRDTK